MRAARRLAAALLDVAARHGDERSREWALAARSELDVIPGDREALVWAIGAIVAVARCLTGASLARWRERASVALRSGLVVSAGIAAAGMVLGVSLVALDLLARRFAFDPARSMAAPLFVVVIPETVFGVGVAVLWKRHRQMASGVLAVSALLVTHAVLHFMG